MKKIERGIFSSVFQGEEGGVTTRGERGPAYLELILSP